MKEGSFVDLSYTMPIGDLGLHEVRFAPDGIALILTDETQINFARMDDLFRYFQSQFSAENAQTLMVNVLAEKVENEFRQYEESMLSRTPEEVFENAGEISAKKEFLYHISQMPDDELNMQSLIKLAAADNTLNAMYEALLNIEGLNIWDETLAEEIIVSPSLSPVQTVAIGATGPNNEVHFSLDFNEAGFTLALQGGEPVICHKLSELYNHVIAKLNPDDVKDIMFEAILKKTEHEMLLFHDAIQTLSPQAAYEALEEIAIKQRFLNDLPSLKGSLSLDELHFAANVENILHAMYCTYHAMGSEYYDNIFVWITDDHMPPNRVVPLLPDAIQYPIKYDVSGEYGAEISQILVNQELYTVVSSDGEPVAYTNLPDFYASLRHYTKSEELQATIMSNIVSTQMAMEYRELYERLVKGQPAESIYTNADELYTKMTILKNVYDEGKQFKGYKYLCSRDELSQNILNSMYIAYQETPKDSRFIASELPVNQIAQQAGYIHGITEDLYSEPLENIFEASPDSSVPIAEEPLVYYSDYDFIQLLKESQLPLGNSQAPLPNGGWKDFDIDAIKQIPIPAILGNSLNQTGYFQIGSMPCQYYSHSNTWDCASIYRNGPIELVMGLNQIDRAQAIQLLGETFGISTVTPHKNLTDSEYARIGLDGTKAYHNSAFPESTPMDFVGLCALHHSVPMNCCYEDDPSYYRNVLKETAVPFVLEQYKYYLYCLSNLQQAQQKNPPDIKQIEKVAESAYQDYKLTYDVLAKAVEGTDIEIQPFAPKYEKDLDRFYGRVQIGNLPFSELRKAPGEIYSITVPYEVYQEFRYSGFQLKAAHAAYLDDEVVKVYVHDDSVDSYQNMFEAVKQYIDIQKPFVLQIQQDLKEMSSFDYGEF